MDKPKLLSDQSGLGAIVIVSIFVSVVTMIVLGFSTVVRREQRQSLDQQLNSQARFAAESKINELLALYRENPAHPLFATSTPFGSCGDATGAVESSPDFDIDITCVQINRSPNSLEFSNVSTEESTVTYIQPDATPINRIVISWDIPPPSANQQSTCRTASYASGNIFPSTLGGSTEVGMLRFDLVPLGGSLDRLSLSESQLSGVLIPSTTGTETITYSSANTISTKPVLAGRCFTGAGPFTVFGQDVYRARVVINVPNANTPYMLRLKSMYRPVQRVKVNGVNSSNDSVQLAREQISVEVTARSADVLSKVNARFGQFSAAAELIPSSAVHVINGLCKDMTTEPNGTQSSC